MFDKEFKKAISELPSKEKDKLILRLLKKDLVLANRLYFELIDERTVDDRRFELEETIKMKIERATSSFWSVGYLMMDMRDVSGLINDHLSMTKDKFGEVSLNLLMLNETLAQNSHRIAEASKRKAHKICIYIIARAFKIMMLIQKLHEDYFMEFEDDLKTLGKYISKNDNLMKTAILNGLDVNWLLSAEIPEDIVQQHKYLRANGFLK
jgi:hypothetical protein